MICKVECKEEKNAVQCDHNALHGKKQLQKYSPESIFYCSTLFGRRLKDQAAENGDAIVRLARYCRANTNGPAGSPDCPPG